MLIEHYKYPTQFIRKTKKAYISVITNKLVKLIENIQYHSYTSLQMMLKRQGLNMHMNYCRKIFATYLRNKGIEQEMIDLLQGRISKSVFVRHYYRPEPESFRKLGCILNELLEQFL
jgi:intergrase/recombinase